MPLIYPVTDKSAAFAALFIAVHYLERIIAGAIAGKSFVDSMPHLGGGTWQGGVTVWAVTTISLLPFFMLREVGHVIGEGRLWVLFFTRSGRGPQ
jgi:hypothetical protein